MSSFPTSAPSANPVFFRTYSRKGPNGRESWEQAVARNIAGLAEVGKLTPDEIELLREMQLSQKSMPSGRWLWVGGTDWIKRPENFSGAYNCTSTNLVDWESFALMMDLAMMGCGTGAVIEPWHIRKLPKIKNEILIDEVTEIGTVPKGERAELTAVVGDGEKTTIRVGDSRRGWVAAYETLLKLSSDPAWTGPVKLTIDLGHVRPPGEPLKGFGGVSNPAKLSEFWGKIAAILNGAIGRRLTSVECCLLIDEAAIVIVAGNVRRSAGMRQFNERDAEAAAAKDNLWQQDPDGEWRIDPKRDALRMANHTRVFHRKPTREEVLDSVAKQFRSGEGAIQYAPEAIARSNADLLCTPELKHDFLTVYNRKREGGQLGAAIFFDKLANFNLSTEEIQHRIGRYGLNPCFAAGTMVLAREGHFPIESLIGKEVEIHDGCQWVKIDNFRVTGVNQPVFNVELHNGTILTVTENHKFILENQERLKTKDLRPGMRLAMAKVKTHGVKQVKAAYLKGFLVGDGTRNQKTGVASCKVYEPKRVCLDRLIASQVEMPMREMVHANGKVVGDSFGLTSAGYLRNLNHEDSEWMLPWCSVYKKEFPFDVLNWTKECQADFIAGLFDSDGTAMETRNGFGYQITSISRSFLEGLGLLLTQFGVQWKIGPARKGGLKDFGPERGGVAITQDTYKLAIPQGGSILLAQNVKFERLKSFANHKTAYVIKDKSFMVKSVSFSHVADEVYCCTVPGSHSFTLTAGIVTAQCGEIQGDSFHCNLAEVHLNLIDPTDHLTQEKAFRAGAIATASLLHHRFEVERYQRSRELDPIIGVSFTGLFDFFVQAFGTPWLKWWEAGRPNTDEGKALKEVEARYLASWRRTVFDEVRGYCLRHNLKTPNRCTTVQPAGSKSLLTGASPGWHPPKAQRFIRRITFRKGDPVALACLDYGYSIVPSQSDKDEDGRLLNDPFDPRCTEWLVEIPTEVPWANLPGADEVDLSKFSAAAQFDFYMQVQTHYTTHNTSATIEYREDEIKPLADLIYTAIQKDQGYISAALLARFDANETFPRLPFEPIDKAAYERLQAGVNVRRKSDDFRASLARYDAGELIEAGPAGCDSDKCLLPAKAPG